ncbi:hypothetical protein LOZ53_002217 [Ophidiomyces ophidiicola]|nr:hypothetical protein LOZ55_004835 [Ophidiomyces ophidiicola]KAI1993172.1 hypothetical protein LOZ53_002217 [Ophidiomyces ophidiicola]
MTEASSGPANQASPTSQHVEQPALAAGLRHAAGVSGDLDAKPNEEPSQITEEQWKAMFDLILAIYEYREPDGHDPTKLFQRSVNKRNVPDYYDVIKEPMALSVLKQKTRSRVYKTFPEFVRDCALIPHNAQTYNRPKSQAYEDALIIKAVLIAEFQKLSDKGIVPPEDAELPDLGEIPDADPLPVDEEDDDEEDDEDDEEADDSDEEGRRRRKRARRGSQSSRRGGNKDDYRKSMDPALRKKRGRPPRVDTPMEARIKAVLKGIRKPRDPEGGLRIRHFEKLPDKAAYPDYYTEIKEPMAVDIIKRKSKRKKYASVDHFMRDIDVMFNNAKAYNQSDSQLYLDAEELQVEAHKLADQEKKKPDSDYIMEDGRLPLPNGISYKDEIWRVGDWVHIQNANDPEKPIIAQVYRTWQDADDQKWVNACWYYRPEQTVHRVDKHFLPNEVMKTGQYRDHRIEEVMDRCFVMFFTRFNRGRPRGFPVDKQVYVCEARYNEEKHKLNKIKTWASCLPDEVREKDYEMDLFDGPRKIRKVPSPIKHLLPADAKDTDDLPKPTWGVENAPPIIGAVHCRPRDENESPPPEPTPPPPPQPVQRPPTIPPRPMSANQQNHHPNVDGRRDPRLGPANFAPSGQSSAQTPQLQPATPMSMMPSRAQPSYHAPSPVIPQYQSVPHLQATQPPISATAYQQSPSQPYAMPQSFPHFAPSRLPQPQSPMQQAINPNAPKLPEFITLREEMNSAIPEDIRSRFQRDARGRVIFFSTPPLDIVDGQAKPLAHSAEHLAAKARRQAVINRERKRILERQKARAEGENRQKLDGNQEMPIKEGSPTVKREDTEQVNTALPLHSEIESDFVKRHEREIEILDAFVAGRNSAKEKAKANMQKEAGTAATEPLDLRTLPARSRHAMTRDHWWYLTNPSKRHG